MQYNYHEESRTIMFWVLDTKGRKQIKENSKHDVFISGSNLAHEIERHSLEANA